ncbi:dephospho-CoA kinase [Saprospiraceae bacterium]|nr:dephospho-CoA kinase [Saprospiraceae bacterium]
MKHLAITGNLGSGKTTICKLFEVLGIPIYYSDKEAKKLMLQDKNLKKQIKDLLGNDAFHRNGRPNRKYIGSKIFSDKSLLASMNTLVHPAVRADYKRWREQQNAVFTLQESALTYEIGADKYMDATIVVYAPEEVLISRGMNRDGVSRAAIVARLAKQMDQKLKIKKADFTINNDGKSALIPQVYSIYKELTK